ncbi:sigma-54 dependent transcriptional regulator, partial [Nitrospinae bacterium AH-259-F20]|nr:sigma-54 dependent transcriptional regulator [Nitrospinae bacterium AH-259-F20]
MPGRNGLEVLKDIGQQPHDALVIMTTAVDDVTTAVEAMRLGAYDYLPKPVSAEHLNAALEKTREHSALKQEVERRRVLQRDEFSMEGVVAISPVMKKVFELANTLGRADRATVCITGETGVGKEVVARTIHQASPRSNQPMVVVNCGALPKELIEAELLGYAKGAFTGAAKEGKKGKVELAHLGTLFLDEIGELPPNAQVVLLRILDDQPFYPVGSDREVRVDVRIIVATNRDLETSVTEGTFREDLFYRLNVAPIDLPPLRERQDDILPLAQTFLNEFNQKYAKAFLGFGKEAASLLEAHQWQGNVRELKNVIERIVLYEDGSEVRPEHISFLAAKQFERESAFVLPNEGVDLESVINELMVQALDRAKGNKSKAARLLGIPRHTLHYRMEKYGLEAP